MAKDKDYKIGAQETITIPFQDMEEIARRLEGLLTAEQLEELLTHLKKRLGHNGPSDNIAGHLKDDPLI